MPLSWFTILQDRHRDTAVYVVTPKSLLNLLLSPIPWRRRLFLILCQHLYHYLLSLGHVVYSLSSADASIVFNDSAYPSYYSNNAVVVFNTLSLQAHWRLCRQRRSLRSVVSITSSADASVFVVKTSGSSSCAEATVVVTNSSGPSSRRRILCYHSRISNPLDTLSIPYPPPTPPLSSSDASVVVVNT